MIDYLSDISDNPLPITEEKSPAVLAAERNLYFKKLVRDKDFLKGKKDVLESYSKFLYKDSNAVEKKNKVDVLGIKNKIIKIAKEQEQLSKDVTKAFKSNSIALYEDMKDTINQFRRYVDIVEDHAKIRKYRSITYRKGDWLSYWNREKLYQEIMKNGVKVMKKFVSAISMEPHAVNVNRFIWDKDENVPPDEYCGSEESVILKFKCVRSLLAVSNNRGDLSMLLSKIGVNINKLVAVTARLLSCDTQPLLSPSLKISSNYQDKVKILESVGYNLMVRFTRLLDDEGVEHNLPVPPLEKKPRKFIKISQTPEVAAPVIAADDQLNVYQSAENLSVRSVTMKDCDLTPATFLQNLAEKNQVTLYYSEVPNQIKPYSNEPFVACRFHTVGAESKGRNKQMAKQAASAQVLASLLTKQKKGTLPAEISHFNQAEREIALSLACEYINYEELLNDMVSKMNTTRTPQYSQIFNVPNGQFSYRCKAVGFNSVGTGRTKEIAKSIGAKLVIEKIEEQKEKYFINKYGPKKAKKLIKLY